MYNYAGLVPPKDHTPVTEEFMLYDADYQAGRVRHQLHVLADAPASHRHRPGPTRLRQARDQGRPGSHHQPPLRAGRRPRRPATLFNPERGRPPDGPTQPSASTTPSSSVAATTGWSTAPIWPRPGSSTLIIERRHLVGGAAITEELNPGFWFTTFSYALCLLRPDIIHELELTKHGFMPLLMPSTFAPGGER